MISKGKLALLKPGNSEMKDFLRFYFISTYIMLKYFISKSYIRIGMSRKLLFSVILR